MAFPQLLPDIYVPTFDMTVAGKKLPVSIAKSILEITVNESLSLPGHFSFRLNDPKLAYIDEEQGLFTEGTRVEISIGFVGNTRRMIVGEISGLTADFPNSGPATVTVDGFDLLHRLTRGTIYRFFGGPDPKDGKPHKDIIAGLLDEGRLKGSIDSALDSSDPKIQDNISNFDFLEQLAREDGCHLWIDGETVYFQTKPLELPNLALEWGKTLMSFSPRLTTAGQVDSVEFRKWDEAQKQSISGRASRTPVANAPLAESGLEQISKGSGGRSERIIVDPGISDAADAKARAELYLYNQQQAQVTGHGISIGQPEMRVGTILTLRGIGRFNGDYTATNVTHSISSNGYRTSFDVSQKP
jgi:phage protein D